MKHASVFSGIDGPAVAADAMGWETLFHCEINSFGQMVLKDKWPKAKLYDNIKDTDFTIWRGKIDVLTGGFPCQPYSAAGKRKGKDDNRHLWPEMLRAVREIKPRWVVPENVPGLINWNGGLVFNEVQTDLENEGYQILPVLLPAVSVNAPHRRDRIFFIAHAPGHRRSGEGQGIEKEGREPRLQQNRQLARRPERLCSAGHAAHADGNGHELWGSGKSRCTKGKSESEQKQWKWLRKDVGGIGEPRNVAHAHNEQLQRSKFHGSLEKAGQIKGEIGQSSRSVCSKWEKFPTQSPVCSGNDGLPFESLRQRIRDDSMGLLDEKEINTILSKAASKWRKETIKAAGNAIVPEVMLQIFKTIEQYEKLQKSQS